MKKAFLALASVLPLASVLGCGSDVSTANGAGGGSTSATSGTATAGSAGTASTGASTSGSSSIATGSSSVSTGTGGGPAGCPPALPPDGQGCLGSQIGLSCEYGDDPRPYCRDFAFCDTGEGIEPTWAVKLPDCPPIAPAADCPMPPDATGACLNDGEICLYPSGAQCGCSSCGGGPCGVDASWYCTKPPAPGCPVSAPNTGQPCPQAGLVCDYGTCAVATALERTCTGGVWSDNPVACPE